MSPELLEDLRLAKYSETLGDSADFAWHDSIVEGSAHYEPPSLILVSSFFISFIICYLHLFFH